MTKEEIIEALTPIARDVFKDNQLVISDDLNSSSVEGWTSLSFMQFLTRIEETFGLKFGIMELIRIKNMGSLIDSIMNKL